MEDSISGSASSAMPALEPISPPRSGGDRLRPGAERTTTPR
uniref:Uncharacterized protein n=1 Tax=Arundo donax TaxID=35708 RepID=A0A0A9HTG0_ARUDO